MTLLFSLRSLKRATGSAEPALASPLGPVSLRLRYGSERTLAGSSAHRYHVAGGRELWRWRQPSCDIEVLLTREGAGHGGFGTQGVAALWRIQARKDVVGLEVAACLEADEGIMRGCDRPSLGGPRQCHGTDGIHQLSMAAVHQVIAGPRHLPAGRPDLRNSPRSTLTTSKDASPAPGVVRLLDVPGGLSARLDLLPAGDIHQVLFGITWMEVGDAQSARQLRALGEGQLDVMMATLMPLPPPTPTHF
ncbi:MAG: hypothetical protein ACPGUV_00210 [Polyangiales bacterium]